jgi:hypothetical protein
MRGTSFTITKHTGIEFNCSSSGLIAVPQIFT